MVNGATGRNGVTALQRVTEAEEIARVYVTILHRGTTERSAQAQQQNGHLAQVTGIAQVKPSQHTCSEHDCNIEELLCSGRWMESVVSVFSLHGELRRWHKGKFP